MINENDRSKILQGITRDECAELTKQLCDIPSPTGSEREIGDFILNWYSRHGIKAIRQEIEKVMQILRASKTTTRRWRLN